MKLCDDCAWYQTEPYVTGTNIRATAHMCYRCSGAPERRALNLSTMEPPIACTDWWQE